MAKNTKVYWCQPCVKIWELAEGAICPGCGGDGIKKPRRSYAGLAAAHGKQTGPKTEAGKAQGLKNIRENNSGPTGESAERTRLNAVKHGRYSSTPIFPAKPGTYPECDSCRALKECQARELVYCVTKTQRKLRRLARAIGSPHQKDRARLAIDSLANLQLILESSFEDVLEMGTAVEETTESSGGIISRRYKAHPSLDPIIKMMSQLGISAQDQQLTPKSAGEQKRDTAVEAFLRSMMPDESELKPGQDMEVTA